MTQDFNHKISICVRKDLPEWQQLNATAHIAAYFGNQLGTRFSTGQFFVTLDQLQLPRNTQYGIALLRADAKDLRRVIRRADQAKLGWMGFTREMLELLDDDQLQEVIGQKGRDEIEYLGIGLYGPRADLESITKGIQAWR